MAPKSIPDASSGIFFRDCRKAKHAELFGIFQVGQQCVTVDEGWTSRKVNDIKPVDPSQRPLL